MSGFTAEYDRNGNMVGRTTREQELNDIFSRDGSFGYGGAKMAAMAEELAKLAKIISIPKGVPRMFGAPGFGGAAVHEAGDVAKNLLHGAPLSAHPSGAVGLVGKAPRPPARPAPAPTAASLKGSLFDPAKLQGDFSGRVLGPVSRRAPPPPLHASQVMAA